MPEPTSGGDHPTASIAPTAAVGSPATVPLSRGGVGERPGDWIGPYQVLEILGEGGFGVVFLAERREPMVQRVALKIIKPGMDSAAVIARFEQERQALAVMDHPNVAKVFDGGVTPSGRPYFVMEHVDGEPISAFADRHRLTLRQRLELFIPVCEAVQHAHHKGLIHRDLKPSNVLVARIEGKPVPKVIDFGVAKAVTSAGWSNTAHTQSGMVIGTPEYMSPEQVAGELDVDTRADVYSLGVMLYHLLAGELPFEPRELRKAAFAEIQRFIREVPPPRPSARLLLLARDRTTTIAQSRSASAQTIAGELRRELDWIPLMALRKQRERRYESPQAIADDLRRYLDGLPLRAAPESRAYLARKFIGRNRLQVAAAASVLIALCAGLGVALWQRSEAIAAQHAEAQQRARADDRADAARRAETAATAARDAEKARADELKQVSDFQARMLGQIDPTKAGAELVRDVRARHDAALSKAGVPDAERAQRAAAFERELALVNATDAAAGLIDRTILRPAVGAIDTEFAAQPVVDAQLRQSLADVYSTIGLTGAALPLQESALSTRRRVLGAEHPDTLASMSGMGFVLLAQGRLADAEPYWRDALAARRRVLGPDHPDTLGSQSTVVTYLLLAGRAEEAEPLQREVLEKTRAQHEDDSPALWPALSLMGAVLQAQGKLAEAEALYRDALRRAKLATAEDHPDALIMIAHLANIVADQNRLDEAEPLYREALEKFTRVSGEEHPTTVRCELSLGSLLKDLRRLEEAEPLLLDGLAKARRVLGEDEPETLGALVSAASVLRLRGKAAEAEPLYREALDRHSATLGEEDPATLSVMTNLGAVLRTRGKLAEAEPYLRDVLRHRRTAKGDAHPDTLRAMTTLAALLLEEKKPQEVVDLLEPSLGAARAAFTGKDAPRLAASLALLGRARAAQEFDPARFALAEANLLEAHALYSAAESRGPRHAETLGCAEALVALYAAWNGAQPGAGCGAKATAWKATLEAAKAGPEPADPAR